METIKKNNESKNEIIYDMCVICGKETPYPREMDIELRFCYIEGAGQLCEDCCKQIYEEKNKR